MLSNIFGFLIFFQNVLALSFVNEFKLTIQLAFPLTSFSPDEYLALNQDPLANTFLGIAEHTWECLNGLFVVENNSQVVVDF